MTVCVFCDIVTGEAPAVLVAEWDDAIAIEPLDLVVPDHVLVLPRVHVRDFMQDPSVTAAVMGRAAELGHRRHLGHANLVTNAGVGGWQSVFHFHVHLLPRKRNDDLILASPRWRSRWQTEREKT